MMKVNVELSKDKKIAMKCMSKSALKPAPRQLNRVGKRSSIYFMEKE